MQTGRLPTERAETMRQMERFKTVRAEVIEALKAQFDERAKDHDVVDPFWARCPFGDLSFAHACYETAGRIVGVLVKRERHSENPAVGSLEDRIMDLANWALMWLTWRKLQLPEKISHDTEAQTFDAKQLTLLGIDPDQPI